MNQIKNSNWWKESVVYQIYPRSFMDSNGDGIGDLNGIRSKITYLAELGIDVIWLSPIYQSPNDDNGYDISNYQAIMEEFGTMEEFDLLLQEAHKHNIKIIMDLVVNHTSDEHFWFQESKKSKDNPFRDFYIWKEGNLGDATNPKDIPNNWESCFGGSAWEYDETTKMYYLHMFSKKQPDLNWENEELRNEIYQMMNWWGEKGIDGFRMDVISMISKHPDFPNGKIMKNSYGDSAPYVNNGPRVHEFLREMNEKVLSKFDWLTVGEGAGITVEDAILYTGSRRNELNMMFHFEHVNIGQGPYGKWCEGEVDLITLKEIMEKWQVGLEQDGWNSLYWDNHDQPRAISRFGCEEEEYREISGKMLAICLHFMKGTPYIYQGEEIGMINNVCKDISEFRDIETLNAYATLVGNHFLSEEEMLHFANRMGRDNARFPMQWDETFHGGFTTGTPWILVNSNYKYINAKAQVNNENSLFACYQKIIQLRHTMPIMVYGTFTLLLKDHKDLFVYTRSLEEHKMLVLCNFKKERIEYTCPKEFSKDAIVLISNYERTEVSEKIVLAPYEAMVLYQ